MLKTKAIELLGGSVAEAARTLGLTYQAVYKWPDVLPEEARNRVVAHLAQQQLPPEKLGLSPTPEASA